MVFLCLLNNKRPFSAYLVKTHQETGIKVEAVFFWANW